MKKVKLLFAASALATISFFAINSNESLAGNGICDGRTICEPGGGVDCKRLGEGCNRECGFLEVKLY
ncbi:hypothetical protein [Marivirga sp.]|uniref:hypothetical protein n=1 Tax=Marivirga sp. TaxID=2018662 RepID=UPI002D7EDA5C|nr:hypothetical protein [Marivirga sp.]HET8860245.1 hypothetical protein [Marivirga sp.]